MKLWPESGILLETAPQKVLLTASKAKDVRVGLAPLSLAVLVVVRRCWVRKAAQTGDETLRAMQLIDLDLAYCVLGGS